METTPRKISARKALIASALLLSIGAGGIAATGAWFTSSQSLAGNQVKTATIALSSAGSTFTIPNIVPIADADYATKATPFSLVVDNTNSTVAVDWAAAVIFPSNLSQTAQATAGRMYVQYSLDNGTTWLPSSSTGLTLSALANAPTTITGTNLAAGATQTVKLRTWLPGSTSINADQGQTISFDLRARAIQAGAGSSARDADANYN